MNEKIYKAMGSSAVSSLVIGICVLATGIAAGVLLIINGSRLSPSIIRETFTKNNISS